MGRIMLNSTLEPGATLTIGGKAVEVESAMSKEEFLSGRSSLEGAKKSTTSASGPHEKKEASAVSAQMSKLSGPSAELTGGVKKLLSRTSSHKLDEKDAPAKPLNSAAPRSAALGNVFKNPVKESTISSGKPMAAQPKPRHDPNAPGALVMKRPDTAPEGKAIVDVVVDPILTKHLREHQREGVKFLYECVMGLRDFNGEGAILADEMGLGKTLQTITLLWTLLKQNPIYEAPPVIKKALIVCPVTLINNWRKEFRKWLGNERIGVFVFDDKRKKLTDFTKGKAYNIMIVGYEKLRTVQEGLIKGAGIDIVIADEGHRLKTVQNKSGQAIQALNTPKRIILSGTPIQNDLSEFFAAVDLVNPGVLGTYKNFMKEFEGPIVRSRQPEATRKDIEKGEARSEELRNLTSMFMLRRTADILSKYLPPKTEYVLLCEPTATQASIYRNVIGSPIFQSALGNTEGAFHLITILKKLCNSPSLLNAKTSDEKPNSIVSALLSTLPPNLLRYFSPSSSGKLRVLDQLLHNLHTTTSEKIVLVSNYTSTLNLLATLLTSLSLPFLRLDGTTPAAKRQSLVDDFNRSPASSCFAFLLSAKAGGTGLNLIGASRLVLFDVDWNPATDMQAMARIHRDGQKRHCWIYRIMLKGALEEKIWQRQVTKIGLADSVMEQKGGMAQFSREELKDLFRLYEKDGCQTHDLLCCDCGGRGISAVSDAAADKLASTDDDKSTSFSSSEKEDGEDDNEEEDIIDLPDLPTLIKASQLDVDAQEAQIRRGSHHLQRDDTKKSHRKKKDNQISDQAPMQQFLAQYSHIDPSAFTGSSSSSSSGGGDQDQNEADEPDLASQIRDPVLLSLLQDEDHGVGFIFEKTACPAVEPAAAAAAVELG
jgi:DNA repair and recombination protein RAD54B